MNKLLYLALPALLATGCQKKAPAPSKTALLTGTSWRVSTSTLTISGRVGTYSPTSPEIFNFTADGKYTDTPATGPATTGTWAFVNNETQLVVTPSGQPTAAPVNFALYSTSLVIRVDYGQAQVQHATDSNNTSPTAADRHILGLLLISGTYFPQGSPVSSASQVNSVGFNQFFVPR